jgi:hypothetical protein
VEGRWAFREGSLTCKVVIVWAATLAAASTCLASPAVAVTDRGSQCDCAYDVYFTANHDGQFQVATSPFNYSDLHQTVTAQGVELDINAIGYADAGIVLESFELGDIDAVNVGGTGPLAVNLWFDTDDDGLYFTGLTPTGTFEGIGNDDYGALTDSTVQFFTHSKGTVSLDDLKAGAVPGIDASTSVAVWIGIAENASAEIQTVNGQDIVDCIEGNEQQVPPPWYRDHRWHHGEYPSGPWRHAHSLDDEDD